MVKGAATFVTTSAHPYQQRYNGNNVWGEPAVSVL
jgi:hypothetical protein